MKLILKILGILILVIIIAMVAIPYFFRDQIVETVKQEINKNLNAKVDFVDFDLSLFRSFPNFNFQLTDLTVINNAPFEGDTLAYIPSLELTLDLMSVIRGEDYEMKKIDIREPVVNALVTESGVANWDIMLETTDENAPVETTEDGSESPFVIQLRGVSITGATIVYDDKSLVTYALLEGVDHNLSGDFTVDYTSLKTFTTIDRLTVIYDGIKYLDRVDADLDAVVGADLVNYIYTIESSELRLNNLLLGFEGSVGMQDNGDINLMLTYSSVRSDFKNFLSLIPAIYAKDFDGLQTSGTLAINGNVKGIYNDESYPAFTLNMLVKDGYFQYPDLPKSVNDVNITTKVNFPGGDLDNITVDIPVFNLNMAGNEISATLFVRKPMTDVDMKGTINGRMDLSKVDEFYPLEEGDKLTGKFTSNASFEGKLSSLENEKYDEFTLLGSLLIEDFRYKTGMIADIVNIKKAQLNFSPEYLDLVNFSLNIGKNNLFAKGRIENFIPYFLADGMLTGNLETQSSYLNILDMMPETGDEEGEEVVADTIAGGADSPAMGVIEIPGDIDFTLSADYKKVIYDNIELNNLIGEIFIRDQAVQLNKLNMGVLDGSLSMTGKYDTKNPSEPFADMHFELKNIGIKDAYNAFGALEKFAPVAQKTDGKFSTAFSMNTLLDKELMPVYSSMNGGGNLQTTNITVENVNSINKLADLLKMPDLKRLSLAPIDVSFEFINGKLHVKPFDIKYEDVKATIGGWTSFDQTINYDLVMAVPRDKFGGQANAVLDNLVNEANKLGTNFSVGETINIKASIVGTLSDPRVSLLPGEASGKNMMEELKKKAQEELEKQKQKLEEEARKELEKRKAEAKKEADKIMADAQKQANKLIADAQKQVDAINKTARESAQRIKNEAQKQADNIMAEAKKKGPIAEIAAKASTDKLLNEANQNADNIVDEAEKKSNNIMNAARSKAEKIKADAKKEADKLAR